MAYSKKQKEKVFEEVFKRIEEGEALRNVLKDEHMPSTSTFFIWLEEDSAKSKQYVCACEARADSIFEDIMDIADESENDKYTIDLGDGIEIEKTNNEAIQRSKLRVDARKWIVSKLNPKKYGDRIEIDTNDGVFSDKEREKRIKELMSKASE